MTTSAAGYIIHDGESIHAIGSTLAEARADLENTMHQAGLDEGWAATLTEQPCDAAMLAAVASRGGSGWSWDVDEDGVAHRPAARSIAWTR